MYLKYFYFRLFVKCVKGFLILCDKIYIYVEVLLIFKMPEATIKEVKIDLEGGAGRPLWQDRSSEKIWLIAINALMRPRQEMQRVSTESETKI